MTDGLKTAHRAAIVDALAANGRVERAVLFGSRATETFTRGSDVDIALFGAALTTTDQARLAAAMEDLTVPQRVDLLLYDRIEDETLREHVRRDGMELYRRRDTMPSVRLDLPDKHRRTLVSLLEQYVPGVEVWAYGSRVNGRSHDGSDLDLVLRGPDLAEIPIGRLVDFEEALRKSNIPFIVEARDWAHLPERFHREIEREHVVLVRDDIQYYPEAWRDMSFSEAVRINPEVRLERGETYPFVDMATVTAGSRCVHAVDQRAYSGGGSRFQDGDTLMARITPCLENGKIARYCTDRPPESAHGSTEFIVIRGRMGVTDSEYAHYLTRWEEVRSYAVDQMTGTSGRQRVPVDSLSHLSVSVPPLPEQRAIAHILGTLDDRIELNRRMNETLEAMARAIFQDWFVDFGPVKAKMESRDPYLPPEIWGLFPDALDDESKPVGWIFETLGRLTITNSENWTARRHPPALEYVDLSNTKWGNIEATAVLDWEAAPSRARRVTKVGDTIIATTRPGNGSFSYISRNGLTVSTGFAVLSPRKTQYREFVYLSATSVSNVERLASLAEGHGGAYPAVKPKEVSETAIMFPGDDCLNSFSDIVSPMRDKIERVKAESSVLAQTRDLLLPKLISGRIRLRDAERLVGDAA